MRVPDLLASPLLAVVLALLGAIVGSFLATLVVRWPEDRSVLAGRSACDACGRTLSPMDLVPLLSALATRGQCRTCGSHIDPVHWQVELACAGAGGTVALVASDWFQVVAGVTFGWLLVALAALDRRALWLPDRLTVPLGLGGVAAGLVDVAPALTDRLIGGAAGFAALWLVARGYRLARGRDGMGGGDPKLFGAIGLWLGWRLLPSVLLIAGLIGIGAILFQRLRGRPLARDAKLPFGTLLAAAAYPAWLVMISLSP